MLTKKCGRCKQVKAVDQFHKSSRTKSGYRCYCKICRQQLAQENKEERAEKSKIWREKNKETLLKKKKLYYENNKKELLRKQKIYADKNREKISAKNKAYRENLSPELKERRKKQEKDYYKKNKHKWKTPKALFNQYKGGAKRRNFEFNISFSEFSSFWQKPCIYCGNKINTIGLDRIDNTVGYKMNNIKSCCTQCNTAKRALPAKEWISWIGKLKNQTDIRNKLLEGKNNV